MTRCKKCGVDKPAAEFHVERRNTSGLSGSCRKCTNAAKAAWLQKQDATREVPKWKEYYEQNKAAAIARAKTWAEKNRDRMLQLKRESAHRKYHSVPRPGRKQKPMRPCLRCGKPRWAPASAVRAGVAKYCSKTCYDASQRTRRPNRTCCRCGTAYWANSQQLRWNTRFCSMKCKATGLDPVKLAATNLRSRTARRARKAGAVVEPIDFAAIKQRDGMRCHICKKKVRSLKDLNFDHVIPLSKGGPHIQSNIAVSHRRCNFSKHDKVLTLF